MVALTQCLEAVKQVHTARGNDCSLKKHLTPTLAVDLCGIPKRGGLWSGNKGIHSCVLWFVILWYRLYFSKFVLQCYMKICKGRTWSHETHFVTCPFSHLPKKSLSTDTFGYMDPPGSCIQQRLCPILAAVLYESLMPSFPCGWTISILHCLWRLFGGTLIGSKLLIGPKKPIQQSNTAFLATPLGTYKFPSTIQSVDHYKVFDVWILVTFRIALQGTRMIIHLMILTFCCFVILCI